jgi:hypothetical protein
MVAGLKLDEVVFAEWLKGATYPVTWSPCSWATQIGSHIRHSAHKRAAEVYARRYFDRHGRLPEGTHHVVLGIDRDLHMGVTLDPRNNRVEADITFPPPPAAR